MFSWCFRRRWRGLAALERGDIDAHGGRHNARAHRNRRCNVCGSARGRARALCRRVRWGALTPRAGWPRGAGTGGRRWRWQCEGGRRGGNIRYLQAVSHALHQLARCCGQVAIWIVREERPVGCRCVECDRNVPGHHHPAPIEQGTHPRAKRRLGKQRHKRLVGLEGVFTDDELVGGLRLHGPQFTTPTLRRALSLGRGIARLRRPGKK